MKDFYRKYGTRAADLSISSCALVVLFPFLAIVALLVRLKLGSPVLFRQCRPGLGGRRFTLVKVRSMTEGRDASGNLLPDAQRLTRFGRWLRKTSLDELPELWNVLKGDMSLVGPRPLLVCDFRKFPKREQLRRFSVKPGITGLWQVSGRSSLPDSERMRLDLEYVDHWSLGLDLKILARTLPVVISADGAT